MRYIIDDRPYAPDPAKEGQQLWITAEKIGKNGNIKKQISWQTIGGPDAERLVESLLSVQHIEIAVTAAPEPGVKMAKSEKEFEKVVKNMGIWKNE